TYYWSMDTFHVSLIEPDGPTLQVQVVTQGGLRTDTLQVHTTTGPLASWQYASIHLGAYAGQQVDIVFQAYDAAGWGYTWWYIDDVALDVLPAQWHSWAPLDGLSGLTGSPEGASSGPGRLDVFG